MKSWGGPTRRPGPAYGINASGQIVGNSFLLSNGTDNAWMANAVLGPGRPPSPRPYVASSLAVITDLTAMWN
jgi:hypothetical protein